MQDSLAYARYLFRHKRFVWQARKRVGLSVWQALVHDWTKFLPSEWYAYKKAFYTPDGNPQYKATVEFARAWNLHQKRNRHHWQYWIVTWDKDIRAALQMPERYVREMIADWIGAGMAKGSVDAKEWYENNKQKIWLHSATREFVECLLYRGNHGENKEK